jgi:LytS/YehU family sensor histidine kinase
MDTIFNDVCVLVTPAFALTLVPGLRLQERSLLSMRDRGVEHVFFEARPGLHALGLLRRRLQALFGHSFRLEARSGVGQGTMVTMRIPLRIPSEVAGRSLETVTTDRGHLAPG